MLAGSPSAAVRRRGGHEDVRQSQSECQFTHLPPEQEVLWKIKTELGETWSCLWTVLSLTAQKRHTVPWFVSSAYNLMDRTKMKLYRPLCVPIFFFSFPRGDCKGNVF